MLPKQFCSNVLENKFELFYLWSCKFNKLWWILLFDFVVAVLKDFYFILLSIKLKFFSLDLDLDLDLDLFILCDVVFLYFYL
jgi:hypothetical protein